MHDFPKRLSLTVTNACNLRCKMCGQWSEGGYIAADPSVIKNELKLADWKRVVDEAADNGIGMIILRGGETFMMPGIIELLEHIAAKGIFSCIDTNGTLLERFAEDLVRIGRMHLTFSVDGPEEVHDAVRGVPGTFKRLKTGIAKLNALDPDGKVGRGACFTISRYNWQSLGILPEVIRSLGLKQVNIVPYYYITEEAGLRYEKILKEKLGCAAFSWRGFHHEDSGVDITRFPEQLSRYHASLEDLTDYPYMPLTEAQYLTWFSDVTTRTTEPECPNAENLADIQPDGSVNSCVDFCDCIFGNIRNTTLAEIWNGDRAVRFREYRRKQEMPVCLRCGAKYMGVVNEG